MRTTQLKDIACKKCYEAIVKKYGGTTMWVPSANPKMPLRLFPHASTLERNKAIRSAFINKPKSLPILEFCNQQADLYKGQTGDDTKTLSPYTIYGILYRHKKFGG